MQPAAASREREDRIPRLAPGWERSRPRPHARGGLPALADRRRDALDAAARDRRPRPHGSRSLPRALAGRRPRDRGLAGASRAPLRPSRSRRLRPLAPPRGTTVESQLDPSLQIPVEVQRRVLQFEAQSRAAVPRAARRGAGRRRESRQARLLPALEGVPPRPLLPARDRPLRREARSDLQEDRRGLRAAHPTRRRGRRSSARWASARRSAPRPRSRPQRRRPRPTRSKPAAAPRPARPRPGAVRSSGCTASSASPTRSSPSAADARASSTRRRSSRCASSAGSTPPAARGSRSPSTPGTTSTRSASREAQAPLNELRVKDLLERAEAPRTATPRTRRCACSKTRCTTAPTTRPLNARAAEVALEAGELAPGARVRGARLRAALRGRRLPAHARSRAGAARGSRDTGARGVRTGARAQPQGQADLRTRSEAAARSASRHRRQAMSRVIGIDLGTTNSCVALIDGGKPVVIPNTGRLQDESLDVRDLAGRQAPGRPPRQAPGHHQRTQHGVCVEAADRAALRLARGADARSSCAPTRSCAAPTTTRAS